MICIRIPDEMAQRRALGYLVGRFSFKSFATGEILVPAYALPNLALKGFSFLVEGPATSEQMIPRVTEPPSSRV